VAFTREPLLAVWEAMNLLEEVRIGSDTPEISNALAVAEVGLSGLIAALVLHAEPAAPTGIRDPSGSSCASLLAEGQ
jgi:hypothetical protein